LGGDVSDFLSTTDAVVMGPGVRRDDKKASSPTAS
jgi:hypothetical protein